MKNTAKKTELFEEMEARLLQAEKDLKEVKKFAKRMKEINKNLRKLSNYYHTDWMDDMDAYHREKDQEKYYSMMSEDSIWNVTQEHYEQKLSLLKTLINSVNKGI